MMPSIARLHTTGAPANSVIMPTMSFGRRLPASMVILFKVMPNMLRRAATSTEYMKERRLRRRARESALIAWMARSCSHKSSFSGRRIEGNAWKGGWDHASNSVSKSWCHEDEAGGIHARIHGSVAVGARKYCFRGFCTKTEPRVGHRRRLQNAVT